MFCPKCGEEISVRENEDAEKIRRLREFIVWVKGTGVLGSSDNTNTRKLNDLLEECK